MKVFYTTDLHGHSKKYKLVAEVINNEKFDLVILGADILPKGKVTLYDKENFLIKNLPDLFESTTTPIIIDFGNDDFYMYYSTFEAVVGEYEHVHISHMKEVIIGDYSIIGMHYVPDYPFGLKDWCRSEGEFLIDPEQISTPIRTTGGILEIIENLGEYFLSLPTIEDYLSKLPKPSCKKVIYNFHAPPRFIGFDLCRGGTEQVGSYAITDFIIANKPFLTLHGHIHESPNYSGLTINRLVDETISIQPGQYGAQQRLVYCTFDTDSVEETYERKVIGEK